MTEENISREIRLTEIYRKICLINEANGINK